MPLLATMPYTIYQRGTIQLLELVEAAAVHEAADHLADVKGLLAETCGDEAAEVPWVVRQRLESADCSGHA
jgi:hypothetical protein